MEVSSLENERMLTVVARFCYIDWVGLIWVMLGIGRAMINVLVLRGLIPAICACTEHVLVLTHLAQLAWST